MKVLAVFGLIFYLAGPIHAQSNLTGTSPATVHSGSLVSTNLEQWLSHVHDAARQGAYVGTFVVTTSHAMSSSRIWHVCEGAQQIERVDALTGVPRSTYRRNDQVVTFLPQSRLAIADKRETLGIFSSMLSGADASIGNFYQLDALGHDRVAGFLTDVVELKPRDNLRFGYRIWTAQNTGLVVKTQTIDQRRGVVEQAAFSELQLGKPLSWSKLSAMMDNTDGFELRTSELSHTTAEQEGWRIKANVPGFKSVDCYKRSPSAQAASGGTLQWVFSDGLATVSLFIETFDEARHPRILPQESFAFGATQMFTRRVGAWWLVAVGEVPLQTLELFAMGVERK